LNETYHSTHGAIQESKHVFIHHGLLHWLDYPTKSSVNILEIGLGTGLNVLLTYLNLLTIQVRATYTGLEPYPIPREYVQQFNYAAQLAKEVDCPITSQNLQATFGRIHQGASASSCHLFDYFVLHKKKCSLQNFCVPPNTFDLVYFDAFSPSKQPTLWGNSILRKVSEMIKQHGIIVTYCAQGKFKRHLKQIGMRVETLPGPSGKKEMTRAWKR
jgi:tRNA U34 5-methylaminomethyl-2-thiouridine-forming methyltransferase MnmC